jgi:hypothetical protein
MAAIAEYLAGCAHVGEETAPLFIPSPHRGTRTRPILRQRVRELIGNRPAEPSYAEE